jgi:predicted aldo/keto reductase-like oxidoreductase
MVAPFLTAPFGCLGPVCRLGLASRGNSGLGDEELRIALDRGVNFLNWCGTLGPFSEALASLGPRRRDVVICVQFEARNRTEAQAELAQVLHTLHTDYIDVLTFYYVEEPEEWQQILGPGGALEFCREAQRAGKVRMLGLTSHQRPLAAEAARSGLLDMLMIRYNAAHRGAETEVFPVTDGLGLPVVVHTCLRWGALLQGTPDDSPGFVVPRAPAWYRFALQTPSVTVALTAPENRAELEEDLVVLDEQAPLTPTEFDQLAAHGRRVRSYAGNFW